jgi:NADH-quinone oxidoreductase subunit B
MLELITSKLEDAANWGRKFSLFTYPFVTACCGMEFMSVAAPKYDIARFGAEFPRFSPRQSDLLMIVGTITEKQGPALRACTTRWPSPSGSSPSASARRPAASTRTTTRCPAPIR